MISPETEGVRPGPAPCWLGLGPVAPTVSINGLILDIFFCISAVFMSEKPRCRTLVFDDTRLIVLFLLCMLQRLQRQPSSRAASESQCLLVDVSLRSVSESDSSLPNSFNSAILIAARNVYIEIDLKFVFRNIFS